MIEIGHSGFEFGLFLLPLLFILVVYAVNIAISIWAYRDARHRGNSKEFAIIVLVGTLFFPIMGLIVYLIIRKDRF